MRTKGMTTKGLGVRPAIIRRELRLSDLLLLTAATAMGCGLAMVFNREMEGEIQRAFENLSSLLQIRSWQELRLVIERNLMGSYLLVSLILITLPFAMAWTLAVIPLLLTGPRLRLRRCVSQPGFMSICGFCLSLTVLALPLGVMSVVARLLQTPNTRLVALDAVLLLDLPIHAGAAVSAAWLTLILGRRWRTSSDWTDRLGRTMGAYWIFAGIGIWAGWSLREIVTTPGFKARWLNPPPTVVLGQHLLGLVKLTIPWMSLVMLGLSVGICLIAWPFSRNRQFSRLTTRPGTMAGVVTSTVMITLWFPVLAGCVVFGATWEDYRYLLTESYFEDDTMVSLAAQLGGLTILMSWITLYLGRQWPAKPTWVDRLGRSLGFLWILAGMAAKVSGLLTAMH